MHCLNRLASLWMASAILLMLAAVPVVANSSRVSPSIGNLTAAGDPSSRGARPIATAQIEYHYKDDTDPLDLYYPASGDASPVVVLLPSGSTGGPEHHSAHGEHLASWGYAVAVVHGVPFIDVTDIELNAARASAALDAVLASPLLAGKVTNRAAIVGTHFNGSSATTAAVRDSRFQAVVGLHPAVFVFGSSAAAELRVPLLVLGGNVEGGLLCPYGKTWQQLYSGARSVHRTEYLFPDARPSDFQEPPYSGSFNFCGNPRDEPFPWIRGLMTAWLQYYLKGEASFYDSLYGGKGAPSLPPETTDSVADNYPQDLAVVPESADSAQVTWRQVFTDTTVLSGLDLMRARDGGGFSKIEDLPLDASEYLDSGLEQAVTYSYTVAYRDKSGNAFQTAEPVSLEAGAPTPTPTRTRRPTNTPRPTRTATSTATEIPPPTATPTEPTISPQVFLPIMWNE